MADQTFLPDLMSFHHFFQAMAASSSKGEQTKDSVPRSKKTPQTYLDAPVHYVLPLPIEESKRRTTARFGTKWEPFEKRFQQHIAKNKSSLPTDRGDPCPLMWLPIEIRAKIWKYAFEATEQAVFFNNKGMKPKFECSMRLVSCRWAEEAWFAYTNALATRTLVILDYPEHGYLQVPCPILADLDDVRLRAIKFVLGDKDRRKADQRNRDFAYFMMTHGELGRFSARTVIVELRKNWLTREFTEIDIANLLAYSFSDIERVRIHGAIAPKRVDRVLQRIRGTM